MKKIILLFSSLIAFSALPLLSEAQISIAALPYSGSENCNSYNPSNASNFSTTMPTGWAGNTAPGTPTYNGQAASGSTGGYYGGGSSGDFSMAALHSGGGGSSKDITYSVSYTNNTGGTITSITLSWDYKQFTYNNTSGWNCSGTGALAGDVTLDSKDFSGSSSGSGITTTGVASFTLTGLSIANGATFGIDWLTTNLSGSDNMVGIDNFSISVPSSTLYYRSITNGNWNANTTWESSTDAAFTTPVNPAVAAPDFNANTITIRNGHTVTASADLTTDQTTIENGGVVNIAPGIALSLNDGAGTDLTVATGGSLAFKSDATGTARITNVGTATISSDNNVTVERYLNDRRAWRLINTPLTATANTAVTNNWQNNFGAGSGVGTNVTGPSGTTGADFTSVSYSLKTFNTGTQLLDNVTDITTANQFSNPYFIFVRGDKTITTSSGHSATTLRAVGNLITGDQTTNASPGLSKFMVVGNPFASPVDFAGFTRSNVTNGFYIWDASLGTLGAYVFVDGGSSFQTTPSSAQTQHIQSGQSFFVLAQAAGAASVTIHEADKSSTNTQGVFRTTTTDEELNLTLSSVNTNNVLTTVDGLRLKRNANYNNTIDAIDIKKMNNVNENLAIANGTETFVIERRAPLTNTNDTVALKFWNTGLKDYRMSFDLSNISSAQAIYLLDGYMATTTTLNLNGNTNYDFTVTNAAGSWDANRFKIVYAAKPALSVPSAIANKGTFTIYPNPTKGSNTTINLNGFAKGNYSVALYNVAGQQVMTTTIVHDGNSNAHNINFVGIASGVYQLQISNETTGTANQKLIIEP